MRPFFVLFGMSCQNLLINCKFVARPVCRVLIRTFLIFVFVHCASGVRRPLQQNTTRDLALNKFKDSFQWSCGVKDPSLYASCIVRRISPCFRDVHCARPCFCVVCNTVYSVTLRGTAVSPSTGRGWWGPQPSLLKRRGLRVCVRRKPEALM